MDDRDRILQRWLDGRLGAGEAAAVEHLLAQDGGARADAKRLERLDGLLRTEHRAHVLDEAAADARVAAIRARLPNAPPERQKQLRLMDIAIAATALVAVTLFYGLVGTMRDLLPLTAMAIVSLIAGAVMIVLARPLRKIETGFITRVLRKRVNLGSGDLLVYRVTGIAIVIGGIWLLSEIA